MTSAPTQEAINALGMRLTGVEGLDAILEVLRTDDTGAVAYYAQPLLQAMRERRDAYVRETLEKMVLVLERMPGGVSYRTRAVLKPLYEMAKQAPAGEPLTDEGASAMLAYVREHLVKRLPPALRRAALTSLDGDAEVCARLDFLKGLL